MDTSALFTQMSILVLIMAAGFLARRLLIIDSESKNHLTRLLLKLTLPATMIASTTGTPIAIARSAVPRIFLIIAFSFFVMILLSILLVRLVKIKKENRGIHEAMALFGNTNFMGIPLVYAFFGSQAMLYGILYNIVFNLLIFSLGMKQIGGEKAKVSLGFFISPVMVSSVLAVIFFLVNLQLPATLHSSIHLIGSITTPAAMLLLGAMLAEMNLRVVFRGTLMYVMVFARLFLMPIGVFFALKPFTLDPMLLQVILLMSATPVAISIAMFAIHYEKHQEIAAKSIFLSTLFSMFTMPLILSILL